MKIKSIGSNQTEVTLPSGIVVLVSYSTPVAAFIPGKGIARTETSHSATTTRHINKWIKNNYPRATVTLTPQKFLSDLIA